MKAVYDSYRTQIVDADALDNPKLDFMDGDPPLQIEWSDPQLVIDPTDDQWAEARWRGSERP